LSCDIRSTLRFYVEFADVVSERHQPVLASGSAAQGPEQQQWLMRGVTAGAARSA